MKIPIAVFVVFVLTVAATEYAYAGCYKCTIRNNALACESGFLVGGKGCVVGAGSCFTVDLCGTDECAIDPLQCIYDRDPLAREKEKIQAEDRYAVSKEGRKLMEAQKGLLGVFLRDMMRVSLGRVYLGKIISGVIRDPGTGGMYDFTGDLSREGEDGLKIILTVPQHPKSPSIEGVISKRGEELTLRVTNPTGETIESTYNVVGEKW